jgi:hypothetical protein
MAQETVYIISQGHYLLPVGRRMDISAVVTALPACASFPPDHMVTLPHGL